MTTVSKPLPWTQNDFLAYLLLYAAHADIDYSEEERAYILSKVHYRTYWKIYKEFSLDNDYQRLNKIMGFKSNNPAFTTDQIILEIHNLFLVDNHFHRMEKFMLSSIRQLLA